MLRFIKKILRVSLAEDRAAQRKNVAAECDGSGQNHISLSETGVANVARHDDDEVVELPFSAVLNVLPPDLLGRLRVTPTNGIRIRMPLALVFPQLSRGSVKVAFGDLRRMLPEGLFFSQVDRDQAVVELPLGEILKRLDPAHLLRRSQQRVSVPDEIASPFDGRGQGLHIYKPDTAPGTAFVRKIQDSQPLSEFPGRVTSSSAAPSEKMIDRVSLKSATENQPPVIKSGTPATSALIQAVAMPEKSGGSPIVVSLGELAVAWPDSIRKEIVERSLKDAVVHVPLAYAEQSLRKGRAVAAWKQVRAWFSGGREEAQASSLDAELLELPLNVIAPLYLNRLRDNNTPKKLHVDKAIPDLFSRTGKLQSPTLPPAAVEIKPSPAVPVSPRSQSVVQSEIALSANLDAFRDDCGKARQVSQDRVKLSGTEFIQRNATPNDLIAKAGGVEGVQGALITLSDGLLVASHLPGGVNGDTLAAFVPQMFSRVAQSAREFRMGELTNLNFIVGNTPWVVFKIGSIFFAAFGCSGGELPFEQLKAIAGELDRKKQMQ